MTEPRLLRMNEVAERLAISRSKAYQLVSEGRLPGAMRVGSSLRVSAAALDAWIVAATDASKTGPAAA